MVVVKLGGSAMEDPAATRGTLESVVALQTLGVRQVLVHGGGKPIDRAMAAAGIEPRKVVGSIDASEFIVAVLRGCLAFMQGRHTREEYGRYGNPTVRALEEKLAGYWKKGCMIFDITDWNLVFTSEGLKK
jgi:hypothetical protein